jgi:hypothetical protein
MPRVLTVKRPIFISKWLTDDELKEAESTAREKKDLKAATKSINQKKEKTALLEREERGREGGGFSLRRRGKSRLINSFPIRM